MSISRLMQMGAAGQGGGDFQISPAFNGKTEWSFAADGSLNIGAHGEYTITPNSNLSVDVKMWGAGGCYGWSYQDASPSSNHSTNGGGGGYSSGTVTLSAGTSYIVQIGEGGGVASSSSGATYVAGGVQSTALGSEGGGYSGIFNTSASQANAILIAGGGGGGGDNRYDGLGAGAGGGSSGEDADDYPVQGGGGGTQSAGGVASTYNNATDGSALTGGLGQNSQGSHGGGGGGYYGGGGGNVGGGGGGSGYIGSGVTSGVTTTGSRGTPANSSDTDRNGSGAGGIDVNTQSGTDGRILISEA